jgi:ribA/ribD-fused uncharacterized protein
MKIKDIGVDMNLSELKSRVQTGEKFEYEFFWYGPFSQWANQGFTVDNVYYKTAEHWMMAEKARIFGDEETRQLIINADHPRRAKNLGREVKNFNEDKWINERYWVVYTGNQYKFTQNADYKKILLGTENRILVEASPEDKIWGIGLSVHRSEVLDPMKWKGLNILGFVLTNLRNNLMRYL